MKCFDWKLERSKYLGDIYRPVAEISVKDKDGNWKDLTVYIDSGADISVFQRSFGELLGLDIEKGKFAVFEGAGGSKVETYIHEVTIRIGDYVVDTRVSFCKDPKSRTPNVLGRLNVFDALEIHFKNLDKKTCFVKTEKL